jgi:hypothetical protein
MSCVPIRGYGLVGHSSRHVIVVVATIAHLGLGIHWATLYKQSSRIIRIIMCLAGL